MELFLEKGQEKNRDCIYYRYLVGVDDLVDTTELFIVINVKIF
jgi:hypothetical protein